MVLGDFAGDAVGGAAFEGVEAAAELDDEDVPVTWLAALTCETESSGAMSGARSSAAASATGAMPETMFLKLGMSSKRCVKLTSILGLTSGGLHNMAPLADQFAAMCKLRFTL